MRELDKESGEKLLDYIYHEMEGRVNGKRTSLQSNNNNNNNNIAQLDKNGHMSAFFIPGKNTASTTTTTTRRGGERGILDLLGDSLGVKTENNIREITKEVLKENDMTIEIIITECQVSITNLYAANILTSFNDLLYLDFKLTDLTLNRELFRCETLKSLFKVNCKKMRKRGITFDLESLMIRPFYTSELEMLGFSIDSLIQSGGIARNQLRSLNYSLEGLISIGFKKEHIEKLKISKKSATRPQPNGFGWSESEYTALMK